MARSSSLSRTRYGGFGIDIEGLERLGADLSQLERGGLRKAIEASLRGAGGEALAAEMRSREPRKTGDLAANTKIHDEGAKGVLVGYLGQLSHGHNGGGRFQKGAWIESGVQPHTILPRDGGALKFNGGEFEKVEHPGFKGRKIAAKSIRAAEWEVLADVVDKIDAMIGGGV